MFLFYTSYNAPKYQSNYTVKDVLYFLLIIFIQSTKQTGIFPKFNLTLHAFLCWHLYFLALQAFDMLYFLELHPLNLTSLFELEFLIVADLAGIVDLTAWSLDMA